MDADGVTATQHIKRRVTASRKSISAYLNLGLRYLLKHHGKTARECGRRMARKVFSSSECTGALLGEASDCDGKYPREGFASGISAHPVVMTLLMLVGLFGLARCRASLIVNFGTDTPIHQERRAPSHEGQQNKPRRVSSSEKNPGDSQKVDLRFHERSPTPASDSMTSAQRLHH